MKTRRYSVYMGPQKPFEFKETWSLFYPVVMGTVLGILLVTFIVAIHK